MEHTDDDESQDITPTREIHPDAWDRYVFNRFRRPEVLTNASWATSDADSEEESEAKVKGDNEDERAQHGFTVSISKPSVPTKPTKPKPSGSRGGGSSR